MRACRVRGVRLRAEGWDGVGVCGMGDGRCYWRFPGGKEEGDWFEGVWLGWVGWVGLGVEAENRRYFWCFGGGGVGFEVEF